MLLTSNEIKQKEESYLMAFYFWDNVKKWKSTKREDQFNRIFERLLILIMKRFEKGYHGQTKLEYLKNFERIKDIVKKSEGDKIKEVQLATKQANLVKDESKAINRAKAARELGHDGIFEVFFNRAYKLGSVSLQDYRDYKLNKLNKLGI